MEANYSNTYDVELYEVIDYFHLNLTTINQSEETNKQLFDLYEAYKTIEEEQIMRYNFLAYILGTLIILSNLTVVISSGLILKKGQQTKSTYLLLGNVSLADTIIGFIIIIGALVDHSVSYGPLCTIQIGMLECQVKVSILSVALITVDRYIYILHGLYYRRWVNTTRVKNSLIFIWFIGVTLGFMPATGWTINSELILTRCYLVSLYPNPLIILTAVFTIVPIIIVCILYTIILVKALKTVRNLKSGSKQLKANVEEKDKLKLRIDRGTKLPQNPDKLFRSVSCNSGENNIRAVKLTPSNGIDVITNTNTNTNNYNRNIDNNQKNKVPYDSASSVYTVESNISEQNSSTGDLEIPRINNLNKLQTNASTRKLKEPNKWRAITVVMLTSGSMIFTWIPYYVTVILFVFCEDQLDPRCLHYWTLLGPYFLPTLALSNSLLNPLIYAWWHKGFQKSVRMYYHKYIRRSHTSSFLVNQAVPSNSSVV